MPDRPFSPAARAFFAALDDPSNNNNKTKPTSIQKKINTLGWRNRYSQDPFYPLVIHSTPFQVQQVQRGEIEGTYGTGATVWPASIVLIKYLEKHALLVGKRVVDLGGGTGIASIAAALLGASHCLCTDGIESVVRLGRDNIARVCRDLDAAKNHDNNNNNNTPSDAVLSINNCQMEVRQYWWGSGSISSPVDVVLVGDCVLPKLYPIAPLVNGIDELLQSPKAVAILSYEYRYYESYDPKTKFIELCQAKNLVVETIPMEQQDSVYSVDDIEIWHVTRGGCHEFPNSY